MKLLNIKLQNASLGVHSVVIIDNIAETRVLRVIVLCVQNNRGNTESDIRQWQTRRPMCDHISEFFICFGLNVSNNE